MMKNQFKKSEKKIHESEANIKNINNNPSFLQLPKPINTDKTEQQVQVTLQLILKSAMFWDEKSKRINRIKSLIMSSVGLTAFQDCEDFKIQELSSIELLSLSKNRISYLSGVSCLQTLICLNVNNNRIVDITPIQSLINLQQFYGNNNLITNLDPLKSQKNQKIKIFNVFGNKISIFKDVIQALSCLPSLRELDIQNNPIWSEEAKRTIISRIKGINRLNGNMITNAQKQSIKGQNNIQITTSTSFWKSNQNGDKNKNQKLIDVGLESAKQKVEQLQFAYMQIDEQFQNEIRENVELKAKIHTNIMKKISLQRSQEDFICKQEDIKLLKRKVKELKQRLLGDQSKKGEMMRTLFQLQLEASKQSNQNVIQLPKNDIWIRKFQVDEVISVDNFQDNELQELLNNNQNTIDKLKQELSYLIDD